MELGSNCFYTYLMVIDGVLEDWKFQIGLFQIGNGHNHWSYMDGVFLVDG